MSILLEAEHLTKTFTQRGKNPLKAVKDVSFTLKKGETLGIVGESGSGKSTIAKLITRLTDITEGTLKFEGKDITRLKQSQLKEVYGDIQMVFQNPVGSFDPRRTLGDGIGESLRNRGMKKADVEKRVAELLEQCGLEKEYAKRYPHEVSGGQCQRAAIARALAVEPKVLICDEATSALDPQTTEAILKLLKKINREMGVTILLITHQMQVVQMICNKVAVMEKGQVIEAGSVLDVFGKPQAPVTKRFVQTVVNDQIPESIISLVKEQKEHFRVERLKFIGSSVKRPVISDICHVEGIVVNILGATVQELQDNIMCVFILQLLGSEEKILKAEKQIEENGVIRERVEVI